MRHGERPRPRLEGLLREILFDPERDHCPGARPVVSVSSDDEDAYRTSVAERALATVTLERRGVAHGSWAALSPEGIVPKINGRKRRVVAWRMRWNAARPIVLPGFLEDEAEEPRAQPADRRAPSWQRAAKELDRLYARLDATLGPALASRGSAAHEALIAAFAPQRLGAALPLRDPERDLARVALPGPEDADLWIKLGRLSGHPADRSLRLRVSFGREVADDASSDEARHRLVRDLATELLPGARLWLARERLALFEELAGEPLFATQPIVYWNAPQGGALFHHDAFGSGPESEQRGVLYLQLTGRTAWLALSITDLALRVREFFTSIDPSDSSSNPSSGPSSDTDAEPEGLAAELLDAGLFEPLRALSRDWRALVCELGQPGCGRLSEVVNRGPEFTAFLVDSGHGVLLEPGDAIVLPNFGLDRTAMHSVFCASEHTGTGFSLALRRDDER